MSVFSPISLLSLIFISIFLLPRSSHATDVEPVPQHAEDLLQKEYGQVIFSSLLFRHGERYRSRKYLTDEHAEFYEKKWGKLTKNGKNQMYQLGIWTRARYAETLLKETPYDPDVLQVLSSAMERTVMSAQLFLAGFYPPTTEDEKWNEGLLWQPIPVLSDPAHQDKTLRMRKYCPRYNLEIQRAMATDELRKFYQEYQGIFARLKENVDPNLIENDLASALTILLHTHDHLSIDQRYGLSRPKWAGDISTEFLGKLATTYYQLQTYTTEMKRLKGGPLVKRIVADMVKRRDDATSRKRFQFYSAHDSTIATLLNTIGLLNPPLQPPYAAMVLIELRERLIDGKAEHLVTVSYKISEDNPPTHLNMPDCKNPCTLDEFIKAFKPVTPDNWERECENLIPDYNLILF